MSRELPPPTPEGALIRRLRLGLSPRLSIPAAARRAGISEETWGHVERGYKPPPRKGGDPIPMAPSAQILAHMANAVGATVEDLEAVERRDAAEILAAIHVHDGGEVDVLHDEPDSNTRIWFHVPKNATPAQRERLRRMAQRLADEYFSDNESEG